MVVGIVALELHLPEARSLKSKRKILKSVLDRIHHRYRVSVAETDYHDLHQRAEVGIAFVHSSESHVVESLLRLRDFVEATPGAVVVRWDEELFVES